MNIKSKLVLFIIGLMAFLYGASAFATLRCGTQLIMVGDPKFVVLQACGTPDAQEDINNGSAGGFGNESYLYYKKDGRIVEIHIIDGKVYSIGGDANRN